MSKDEVHRFTTAKWAPVFACVDVKWALKHLPFPTPVTYRIWYILKLLNNWRSLSAYILVVFLHRPAGLTIAEIQGSLNGLRKMIVLNNENSMIRLSCDRFKISYIFNYVVHFNVGLSTYLLTKLLFIAWILLNRWHFLF